MIRTPGGGELVVSSGRRSFLLNDLERSSISSSSIEDDHKTENTASSSVVTIQHSNVSETGRAMAEYNRAKRMIEAYLRQWYTFQVVAHLLDDGVFVIMMRRRVPGLQGLNTTDAQIIQIGQEYLDSQPTLVEAHGMSDETSVLTTEEGPAVSGPGNQAGNDEDEAARQDGDSEEVQNYEPIPLANANSIAVSDDRSTPAQHANSNQEQRTGGRMVGEGTTTTTMTGSDDDRKPAAKETNADGVRTTSVSARTGHGCDSAEANGDSINEAAAAEEDPSAADKNVAKKRRLMG